MKAATTGLSIWCNKKSSYMAAGKWSILLDDENTHLDLNKMSNLKIFATPNIFQGFCKLFFPTGALFKMREFYF